MKRLSTMMIFCYTTLTDYLLPPTVTVLLLSLARRYGHTYCKTPCLSHGHAEIFDVDHALNCAKGRLVYNAQCIARSQLFFASISRIETDSI